ncbi:hypothetical protein DSO57_1032684 [Entomophthora muscae]|uniref:Uncharacterized protein n=1 Tax=Entomophthora muscae TaxID=34485 RepID=A0ACC2T070_9FUNG|nr:hypothetical protein DSO57_1032684 [Entomophthora muscae]
MILASLLFPLGVFSSVDVPKSVLDYKGEVVPVLVQFDPPTNVITKVERGQYGNSDARATALVKELQKFATKSQAAAVAFLDGLENKNYRSYYISNTLAVDAPLEAIKKLASFDGIKKVAPNFAPSKPQLNTEGMDSVSKKYKSEYYPEFGNKKPRFREAPTSRSPAIKIINAHNVDPKIISKAKDLVFGNLDSGVDLNHPVLKDNYKGTKSNHNYAWFEATRETPIKPRGNKPLSVPHDNTSHGTRVVSLAVGKNGIGVSPESKWIACKAIDNLDKPTTEYYLSCQQFLLAPTDLDGKDPDPKQRPHVIGNSWTCTKEYNCFNEPFIYASHAHHVAGIFNVAAAGNSGYLGCGGITYPPAENKHSFVIAAVEQDSLTRTLFSSLGPSQWGSPSIDVSAPGDHILAAEPDGAYGYESGTSFAAPLAAGGSLLVMAACPHLQRDPSALAEILHKSATPKYSTKGCGGDTDKSIPNNEYGFGLLDVQKAINLCTNKK